MERWQAAATLGVALMASGCASTIKVDRFDGSPSTMKGVPYNLPMTQFTLTVTRHFTGCGAAVTGSMEVAIAAAQALDPSGMFTLSSDGWFATSDIKSTYGTAGFSTGLNTDFADQTGTVITDAVSAVAAIAPLVLAAGAAPGAAPPQGCQSGVPQAVSDVTTLTPKVSQEADDLAQATAKTALLTSELGVLGDKADFAFRQSVVAQMKAQSAIATQLAADQKALADAVKLTTAVQTITWPKQGDDPLTAGPFKIPDADLKKLVVVAALRVAPPNPDPKALPPPSEGDKFNIFVKLERDGPLGVDPAKATAPAQLDVTGGIPVRFPVPGTLSVCGPLPCSPDAPPLKTLDGQVLQLGLAYSVPIKGGQFQSVTGALAIDPVTGAPQSVQVTHKASAATALSGAVKGGATTIAGVPAAIDAAKLAKLKAQSDYDTQASTLATAKATLAGGPDAAANAAALAPIQAETALAKAKLDQITADQALAAASTTLTKTPS
ncbi:hypothetical protein [Phenylobacterium sp.]|jgi:hypothetical protein|uniref:hypothetical protein n=1 Tax=Phenylobacterium sp. TaxID=1871053 RepID=UPI002E380447|nr:hypothetical protein [Phenylobacterium sp.]HEX3366053.1 hypothetical protein [Phenylobacterium sp.]